MFRGSNTGNLPESPRVFLYAPFLQLLLRAELLGCRDDEEVPATRSTVNSVHMDIASPRLSRLWDAKMRTGIEKVEQGRTGTYREFRVARKAVALKPPAVPDDHLSHVRRTVLYCPALSVGHWRSVKALSCTLHDV